jgi:indole-3-glycerol phosphate synthase
LFLDDLTRNLSECLSEEKKKTSLASFKDRRLYGVQPRGFLRALRTAPSRRIIAELKKSSPSRGTIRREFDPESLARCYEENGATAISVLTEERFFGGKVSDLETVHDATRLPLLRKDFLVDSFQIHQARGFGADAVLLIVAILDDALLQELYLESQALGMDVLVEVHSEAELERALVVKPDVLGINNRDLGDLRVDLSTTERLLPMIPRGVFVVAESGFRQGRELADFEAKGVHAFLIGEWLMEGPDPGERLRELLQWSK